MDPSEIRALAPSQCPHCHGDIVIEFKSAAPYVTKILTPEEIREAKEKTVQRVYLLPLSEEKKKSLVAWLRQPEVVFSPSDVDSILTEIINENDITKES
jgi:glutaredoxin